MTEEQKRNILLMDIFREYWWAIKNNRTQYNRFNLGKKLKEMGFTEKDLADKKVLPVPRDRLDWDGSSLYRNFFHHCDHTFNDYGFSFESKIYREQDIVSLVKDEGFPQTPEELGDFKPLRALMDRSIDVKEFGYDGGTLLTDAEVFGSRLFDYNGFSAWEVFVHPKKGEGDLQYRVIDGKDLSVKADSRRMMIWLSEENKDNLIGGLIHRAHLYYNRIED